MICDFSIIPEGWFLSGMKHRHTQQVFADDKHEPIEWEATVQSVGGGQLKAGVGPDPQTALINAVCQIADIASFTPLTRVEEFTLYGGDMKVKINITGKKVAGVLDLLLGFIRGEECTNAETLHQSDSCLLEAPNTLSSMIELLGIEDRWIE